MEGDLRCSVGMAIVSFAPSTAVFHDTWLAVISRYDQFTKHEV